MRVFGKRTAGGMRAIGTEDGAVIGAALILASQRACTNDRTVLSRLVGAAVREVATAAARYADAGYPDVAIDAYRRACRDGIARALTTSANAGASQFRRAA
jgi:hypothetical protein